MQFSARPGTIAVPAWRKLADNGRIAELNGNVQGILRR
jgi:hypothetical protein